MKIIFHLIQKKINANEANISSNLSKTNDLSSYTKISDLFIFNIPSKSDRNVDKVTSLTIIEDVLNTFF